MPQMLVCEKCGTLKSPQDYDGLRCPKGKCNGMMIPVWLEEDDSRFSTHIVDEESDH